MANQIKKKFIDGAIFTEIQGNINTGVQSAKDYADSQDLLKLQEAKNYADQVKSDLLNGAGPALDTLKELGDLLTTEGNAVAALAVSIGTVDGKVDQEVIDRGVAVQSAKDYADTQDAAKLVEAKSYTDAQIAAIPAVNLTPYLKKDGTMPMTGNLNMAEIGQAGPAQNKIVKVTFNSVVLGGDMEFGNISITIDGIVYTRTWPDLASLFAAPQGDGTYSVYGGMIAGYLADLQIPGITLSYDGNTGYLSVEGASDFNVSEVFWGTGSAYGIISTFQNYAAGSASEINHKIVGLADGVGAKDAVNKGQVEGLIAVETSRAQGQEAVLDAKIDAKLIEAKDYAYVTVGTMGDALASRLNIVEPKVATLETEMTAVQADVLAKLQDAKNYADAQIAAIPPVDISGKADITYVDDQDAATLASANGYADAAVLVEKNRAEGVESALDGRLDILEPKVAALEALEHKKFKKTLVAGDIAAGYVDLPHLAVAGSTVAFVDRLAIHEGATEDYSVSVVGGVTRITFQNDLVHPGQSALQAGDNLFVKYVK